MLNGLDLFSGIGGISVALSHKVKTAAYCEKNRYCQAVLLSRMSAGDIDAAPIWDDIKTLQGGQFKSHIDIISGGFPCQDISAAGRGAGLEGERSGLFYEILRLCGEIEPRLIFLENVPAITTRGGTEVARELAKMGYDCRWCIISAASVGTWHKRERWFLLAHTNCPRRKRYGQKPFRRKAEEPWLTLHGGWEAEPNVDRVVHGLPYRVDRIRALGNSVVPQQARKAFDQLLGK